MQNTMEASTKNKLKFTDIIDNNFLNNLFQQFYTVSGIPVGLLEPDGNILVQVGWQKICMEFHREGEFSCKNCNESDTLISNRLHENPPILYKCKNGLNDVGMPVIIDGQHLSKLLFSSDNFSMILIIVMKNSLRNWPNLISLMLKNTLRN